MEKFKKYQCLSGSVLKVFAVASMVIDHIASILIFDDTWKLDMTVEQVNHLYAVMRLIGRLAFPLYAFLLVEGFTLTKNRKKYGIRLSIFALLSEIPWDLSHFHSFFYLRGQNVIFTLLLGFLGLCVLEDLEKKHDKKDVLYLLGLLFASILLNADFGWSGFGFILLLWVLRKLPIHRAIIGSCFLHSGWRAGLAFIPICLYNGKRGFIKAKWLKLLFYAIYPLHLLILYLIKRKLGGF
ncbi:MAG: TraX protein [Lachnospiraceae bacterium]|nr:TraX protein [Lachnospiraceae bacterium]